MFRRDPISSVVYCPSIIRRSMFGVRRSMFPSPPLTARTLIVRLNTQLSTINNRQSDLNHQLRKGAWLPRSFTLSTLVTSDVRFSPFPSGNDHCFGRETHFAIHKILPDCIDGSLFDDRQLIGREPRNLSTQGLRHFGPQLPELFR